MYKHIIIYCLAVLTSVALFGQSEIPLFDSLNRKLVITHSKVPVTLKSTFKPTIVIDKVKIDNHINDDISLLLEEQVGISVAGAYSNPGKDKSLFLQGAGGEYSLILVDGVPVTDPSGIGGTFDLRSFSLNQIERIEIIKGGQSALYGSDAVAGVINLITTRENTNSSSGSIDASYGTYNSNSLAGLFLLNSTDWNFTLGGSRAGSSGISEALDENNTGFDKDPYRRNALHSTVKFTPSQNLKAQVFARYSEFDGDFDGGAYTDGTDTYQTDWLNTGLIAKLSGKKATSQIHYTYNKTNRTFESQTFGISLFKGRSHNADVFSQVKINQDLGITIGFNYQLNQMIDESAPDPVPNVKTYSPYASISFQSVSKFNAEAGLRINRHNTFGTNSNISLGASYWLSSNVKFFSHYTTSFKAPNLFQLYGQFGANPALQPQNGKSINLGFSFDELGILDNLKFSAFKRSVDQLIVYNFANGYLNLPSQNDLGLEISLQHSFNSWKVSGSYEFLFGELDDQVSMPVENLFRRPKHQFNASISYNYRKTDFFKFSIRHTGERNDLYFDTATFLTEAVVLESYLFGMLESSYSVSDNFRLQIRIDNLFDADFQEIAGFSSIGRSITIGGKVKVF